MCTQSSHSSTLLLQPFPDHVVLHSVEEYGRYAVERTFEGRVRNTEYNHQIFQMWQSGRLYGSPCWIHPNQGEVYRVGRWAGQRVKESRRAAFQESMAILFGLAKERDASPAEKTPPSRSLALQGGQGLASLGAAALAGMTEEQQLEMAIWQSVQKPSEGVQSRNRSGNCVEEVDSGNLEEKEEKEDDGAAAATGDLEDDDDYYYDDDDSLAASGSVGGMPDDNPPVVGDSDDDRPEGHDEDGEESNDESGDTTSSTGGARRTSLARLIDDSGNEGLGGTRSSGGGAGTGAESGRDPRDAADGDRPNPEATWCPGSRFGRGGSKPERVPFHPADDLRHDGFGDGSGLRREQ